MALALSDDRPRRVVAAVEEGVSCRAAAARFEIAPSTAIKWLQRWRRTGSVQPRSRLRCRVEGRQALASAGDSCHGNPGADRCEAGHDARGNRRASRPAARIGCGTQHRVATARPPRTQLQKKRRTPPSSSGLTSGNDGWPGSRFSPSWHPSAWCSSTRPAPRPKWPGATAGHAGVSGVGRQCRTATGRRPPSSVPSATTG